MWSLNWVHVRLLGYARQADSYSYRACNISIMSHVARTREHLLFGNLIRYYLILREKYGCSCATTISHEALRFEYDLTASGVNDDDVRNNTSKRGFLILLVKCPIWNLSGKYVYDHCIVEWSLVLEL